jgi:hypothetical protein
MKYCSSPNTPVKLYRRLYAYSEEALVDDRSRIFATPDSNVDILHWTRNNNLTQE